MAAGNSAGGYLVIGHNSDLSFTPPWDSFDVNPVDKVERELLTHLEQSARSTVAESIGSGYSCTLNAPSSGGARHE